MHLQCICITILYNNYIKVQVPLSPQGSHEQNACETFFFYYPNPHPSQTRRIRPDKEDKTKQGEGESIEEKEKA